MATKNKGNETRGRPKKEEHRTSAKSKSVASCSGYEIDKIRLHYLDTLLYSMGDHSWYHRTPLHYLVTLLYSMGIIAGTIEPLYITWTRFYTLWGIIAGTIEPIYITWTRFFTLCRIIAGPGGHSR